MMSASARANSEDVIPLFFEVRNPLRVVRRPSNGGFGFKQLVIEIRKFDIIDMVS